MAVSEKEIERALEALAKVSKRDSAGHRTSFLATIRTEHEFVVSGNAQGLVKLAEQILSLAKKEAIGSHIHFDEYSNLDACEWPLVLRVQTAEWDNAD